MKYLIEISERFPSRLSKLKGMNHNDILGEWRMVCREGTEYRYDLSFEGKQQYFQKNQYW